MSAVVGRRSLVSGAAWAVPVVAGAAIAPAVAASGATPGSIIVSTPLMAATVGVDESDSDVCLHVELLGFAITNTGDPLSGLTITVFWHNYSCGSPWNAGTIGVISPGTTLYQGSTFSPCTAADGPGGTTPAYTASARCVSTGYTHVFSPISLSMGETVGLTMDAVGWMPAFDPGSTTTFDLTISDGATVLKQASGVGTWDSTGGALVSLSLR